MGPQQLSKTQKTHSLPLPEESTIDSRRCSSLQITFANACASFDSLFCAACARGLKDNTLVHSVYM
jgi:hypothetical protein